MKGRPSWRHVMWTAARILAVVSGLSMMDGAALAALGGDAASVDRDHVFMKAQRRVLPQEKYTVQEMLTASGTKVREYLSPAGRVFAVAWQGPHMPDLQQLFGDHFATFRDAAIAKRKGRGPLRFEESGLVVESGGHMRGFVGRAYLPRLMPDGMAVDDIR